MSKKEHMAKDGLDRSTQNKKGECQQSHQKGAKSISKQNTGKHKKDESGGADKNTTKRAQTASKLQPVGYT